MAEPPRLPGKFIWFELTGSDTSSARAFYRDLFGWKLRSFSGVDMIFTGDTADTMIGDIAVGRPGESARWLSMVSVPDVDAAVAVAAAHGGTVIESPHDIPMAGRAARIADPQGAHVVLFTRTVGDPPDRLPGIPEVPTWCWNELTTTDAAAAVAFYAAVVGYTSHAVPMGPDREYHLLGRAGIDRAGVAAMLPVGTPAFWLPYVAVRDADATLARATALGATIQRPGTDIPTVGRFGILVDPSGAVLAVLQPIVPS